MEALTNTSLEETEAAKTLYILDMGYLGFIEARIRHTIYLNNLTNALSDRYEAATEDIICCFDYSKDDGRYERRAHTLANQGYIVVKYLYNPGISFYEEIILQLARRLQQDPEIGAVVFVSNLLFQKFGYFLECLGGIDIGVVGLPEDFGPHQIEFCEFWDLSDPNFFSRNPVAASI